MSSNRLIKTPAILISFLVFGHLTMGQNSPVGQWITVDDESGKPKSIVEIYDKNGLIFGRIVRLFREPGEDPDPICDLCSDHRKGQKITGMIILNNIEKDGDEWAGGQILDPENGKTYRCRIWLENGSLKVRGYLAFFFRTQTWSPN